MPSRGRACWMIVSSPGNYERTQQLRFTEQGVKSAYLRYVEKMAPGDGMVWYVTGIGTFAATAEIAAPYFESKKKIWISEGRPDAYPWRVKIKNARAVAAEAGVRASTLVPKLRFVKKWPAAHWRLAFQGMLHELPASDFALIDRALAKA